MIVAPSAAPEAAPICYGSARGFLKSPWYIVPENANPAPTIAARVTRGSLRLSKIVSWD